MAEFDERALEEFRSIFGDLFGASRTSSKDLTIRLEITLVEAAHGGARDVELPRTLRCEPCHGRGGVAGATFEACSACGGRGGQRTAHGALVTTTRCTTCDGKGGRWSRVCPACGGRGETVVKKAARVQIPPGIEAGSMLRLAGQGNDLGEGAGDALLLVEVAPHDTLRRAGADLHTRVRVDAKLAKTGGDVSVPWLTGEARVRVPAGMVDDTEVRLAGWGCVKLGSPYAPPSSDESPYRGSGGTQRGDLVVTLTTREGRDPHDVLELPKTATSAEVREAYRRLTRALRPDGGPDIPDRARKLREITEAYVRLSPDEEPSEASAPETASAPAARPTSLLRATAIVAAIVVFALALAWLRS